MFIKQRSVRRSSKFTSKFALASRRRREYATTLYVTAFVQFLLSAFLVVSAIRIFLVMRVKLPDLPWYITYGVPIGILLIALLAFKMSISGFRQGIDIRRHYRSDKP